MPFSDPKLVSDLLTRVKLKMHWDAGADGNAPYEDDEIVTVAQDLVEAEIYPAIERTCEDYLTTFIDLPLVTAASYGKTPGYPAPIESMSKVVYVALVDLSGEEHPLQEYDHREWHRNGRHMPAAAAGYSQQGGRIFLHQHPTDVSGLRLRLYYVARPLKMTASSTTTPGNAVLTARLTGDPTRIDGPPDFVRFETDTDMQPWESTGAFLPDALSILSGAPPHLAIESYDVGTVIAFATTSSIDLEIGPLIPNAGSGIPTGARVGDFLVADRETPLVQLPIEGYRLLVLGVAAELSESIGDTDKYTRTRAEFVEGLQSFASKLVPRNRTPETYVNWNSPGRTRRRGWR